MRTAILLAILLVVCTPLAGCKRRLDERDVREFIDQADDTARKRFAPEICELRGEKFTMHSRFQGFNESAEPTEMDIDRKLYCKQAGRFSQLRQYKLDRNSLDIKVAADRKTARVTAEYTEVLPFYDLDRTPATPDDFQDWQIVESLTESVVGIEGGDLVYLSTNSDATQSLTRKSEISLPYD